MIIWGTRGETKALGKVGLQVCEICQREQPFNVMLQYRFAHLYFIFAWVTSKQYFLVCEVCQGGWELDPQQVEANLPRHPIPFYQRYGWSFLVALVVLFALSVALQD